MLSRFHRHVMYLLWKVIRAEFVYNSPGIDSPVMDRCIDAVVSYMLDSPLFPESIRLVKLDRCIDVVVSSMLGFPPFPGIDPPRN